MVRTAEEQYIILDSTDFCHETCQRQRHLVASTEHIEMRVYLQKRLLEILL